MKKTFIRIALVVLCTSINTGHLMAQTNWHSVLLGRPTDHSIAVSVLSSNDLLVYVEYGGQSGVYTNQTATNSVVAGTPSVLTLDELQPDSPYCYRLLYRAPDETNFSAGGEHTFRTQRAPGGTFTFIIEADPHYLDNRPPVWQLALTNMLVDNPDFLIDLGDTFMGEKYFKSNSYTLSEAGIYEACKNVRDQFFSVAGHSIPLFLVNGNHDPELGWLLDNESPTNNSAVWGAQARNFYYPCPVPDAFYSGSTNTDPYLQGTRDGYYAFQWGDALFVVLDPYWYTSQGTAKGSNPWAWTLGTNQYQWLKRTLETSPAPFKFVFAHNLVGGGGEMNARGGLAFAPYFEWGGYNTNGTWGFDTNRPGWAMPIQDLFLTNGVNVFFHGHDHLFVKEDLDVNSDGIPDLIYQECPQPGHTNYNSTNAAAGYGYTNGVVQGNSGYLRILVTPTNATVDYVRVYLPEHEGTGKTNRMVTYSYTIAAPTVTNTAFPGTIIPGRPTDSTVAMNVLAPASLQAYFEYGSQAGVYSGQTAASNLTAGEPVVMELTGLPADTRCYYRLRFRYSGETSYRADAERSFHTQRAPGSTFTFAIHADPHNYDKKGNTNLYQIAMENTLADMPDFLLDLGDTFGDDHNPTTITYAEMEKLHLNYRPYFDLAGRAAALFLCIGNHEGETIGYEYPDTNANPICTYATQTRLRHYPNPFPNGFYSGNTNADTYVHTNRVAGLPGNYYAWEWGNALFVVLDAYRYLPSAKPTNLWDWTLGQAQYDWFKRTLESSDKPYKFVFAHHVLGQTRGGAVWADKCEWGGENMDGSWGFTNNRPGWALPIHQLMVSNNVTIFFQGHDHLYAQEELDGLIYQEVPMPSDSTYHVGDVNADDYIGVVTNNSGHLRVTVAPSGVTVDYVRAFLPADEGPGQTNGMVTLSYTVGGVSPALSLLPTNTTVSAGGDAIFAALATGTPPLSYQWQKNGAHLENGGNVSGATTDTLTLTNVQLTDAGGYSVIVTNAYGSITSVVATLTVNCPTLTVSPGLLPNGTVGVAYSQTITAGGGIAPYTFAETGGGLPAGLILNTNSGVVSGTPTAVGSTNFTITATDAYGCTGSRVYSFGVGSIVDTKVPSITLKWPPNSTTAIVTNSPLVVTGIASDTVGLATVEVSVDNGAYVAATGTTNWSLDVGDLTPGLHTVTAKATDTSLNVKQTTTNTFFYGVMQTLTIVTNDVGSATLKATATTYGTPVDGGSLMIGRPYKFMVTPTDGNIYSNTVVSWTGGESNFTGTTVTFTMQSNTVITVNAPTNWFLATTGTYYGLFSSNAGIDIKSAGYFKLKVKAKASALPTFSINVQVDGEKVGGSGSFNLDGEGELKKPIMRKKSGQADLLVSLALDLANQKVTGTVTTTNGLWTADLLGDQALWTLANPATNYDGQYTLVLTGDVSSVTAPGGDGYGTVTITDTNGAIKLTGNQGEGNVVNQKTGLSKDGLWPMFVMGQKDTATGIYKSMIMGWVTVAPEPSRDLSGTLTRIKQAFASPLYPAGFTNEVDLLASKYVMPVNLNELAISLTPDITGTNGVGQLTLDAEANLTPAVTVTNIVLAPAPKNKWLSTPAYSPELNPVTLKLTSLVYKTGVVKGNFMHGVTKTAIIGVILQQDNVARGYFQNGGESGSFLLQAQP